MAFLDEIGLSSVWNKFTTKLGLKQNQITTGTDAPSGGVDGDVYIQTGAALPIKNGGTNATDAATARSNLGITLANLGITATATELNKMDGVTATTTELNYIDGVTSNIQTQLNNKATLGNVVNFAGLNLGSAGATPYIYTENNDVNFRYSHNNDGNYNYQSIKTIVNNLANKSLKGNSTANGAAVVLWSGSSQAPSFTVSNLSDYKYFLVQPGSSSSLYNLFVMVPYCAQYANTTFRGVGGFETESNGFEMYAIRGTVSGTTVSIAECYYRTPKAITSDNQCYVRTVIGIK